MRIEKWGFLLSYAMYLIFAIGFSIFSKDTAAINSMVFSITIASAAFSISDLIFTKINIDEKTRELLVNLYTLNDFAIKFYTNKIEEKYREKNEELLSCLMKIFAGHEDKVEDFYGNKLSIEEQEKFLNKVKACSNDELTKFVITYMEAANSVTDNMINEEAETEDIIQDLQNKQKEVFSNKIASVIAILGLVGMMIVLTTRISIASYVNNILTIIAFLCVIITLLLKDYYNANSLKKLEEEKSKLLKDLQESNAG